MSKLSETRDFLIERYGCCERCGSTQGLETHHTILGRKKGDTRRDVVENCCLVCHACHGRISYEFSQWFWAKRESEGYNMQAWIDSLNLKVKPENYKEQK